LLLALSLCLGYALDAWLPPVPRWTRQGDFFFLGFTSDGQRFWTAGYRDGPRDMVGPVQFRDVHTGHEVQAFLHGRSIADVGVSEDDRILAAVTDGDGEQPDELWCFDMANDAIQRAALTKTEHGWTVSLSPHGTLVAVRKIAEASGRVLVFETTPLRLIRTLPLSDYYWRWSDDDSGLAYRWDHHGMLCLYRLGRDGDRNFMLPEAGRRHSFTADGRTLITSERLADQADGAEAEEHVLVWDVGGPAQTGSVPKRVAHNVRRFWPALMPDGRSMIISPDRPDGVPALCLWDLVEHRSLGELPMSGAKDWRVDPVEGNLFTVKGTSAGSSYLALYRARPLTFLWQHQWSHDCVSRIDFCPDANALLVESQVNFPIDYHLDLFDLTTGSVRLHLEPVIRASVNAGGSTIAVILSSGEEPQNRSKVGEWIDFVRGALLSGRLGEGETRPTIRVIDTIRGEEVLRVDAPGTSDDKLAPGGQSLLILHSDNPPRAVRMMCFDIPRRVSWMRVAMVPLAACAVLIAWCTSRRLMRWRRERRLSRLGA
jgi:hypothetical protein